MSFPLGQIVGPSTHDEIDQFLKEWKPSAGRAAPRDWYWCHLAQATSADQVEKPAEDDDNKRVDFEEKGGRIVDALVARVAEIEATAPTHAKKGEKSQKALRAVEHAKFADDVKELAHKYNVLSGKWMFFASPDVVDQMWSKIVKALADADGPLAQTGVVKTAKVAPEPQNGDLRLICVYVNDSWDLGAVERALRCLVEDLHLVSNYYKCDAYTILGIQSGHPSRMKTTLYSKTDFMSQNQIDTALATKPKPKAKVTSAPPAREEKKKTPPPKEVKKKTFEEEQQEGLGDFDDVSDSEDEEPVHKKQKTQK